TLSLSVLICLLIFSLYSVSCIVFLFFFFSYYAYHRDLHSFPTRRSSDLIDLPFLSQTNRISNLQFWVKCLLDCLVQIRLQPEQRSEEHTSELQSRFDLVCRLLLEKKKKNLSLHK